jgi:hypothetical protein
MKGAQRQALDSLAGSWGGSGVLILRGLNSLAYWPVA